MGLGLAVNEVYECFPLRLGQDTKGHVKDAYTAAPRPPAVKPDSRDAQAARVDHDPVAHVLLLHQAPRWLGFFRAPPFSRCKKRTLLTNAPSETSLHPEPLKKAPIHASGSLL